MITIENTVVRQEQFGDNTLKCSVFNANSYINGLSEKLLSLNIAWCYDNDSELFTLWCLVNDLRQQNPHINLNLHLPYIPHAMQDRNVSGRLFTLKYFANLINQMNFEHVYVLDPHSDVSLALIDRVVPMDYDISSTCWNKKDLWKVMGGSDSRLITPYQIMYPDNGAAKKYGTSHNKGTPPPIIGNKHRNEEGRIDSYELSGLLPETEVVLIRDDISSFGGTFVAAAKALKAKGVKKIYLAVSHCENNILKGEVFNYIDEVWTTDSICTAEHPQLHVEKLFRGNVQYV